jgi:drug/metabolite transporter (DMT)-like permease
VLAAIGGIFVVALPMLVGGAANHVFNPLSVFLVLVNCVVFPLAMINMRQANERGVPLTVMLALHGVFVAAASLVLEPLLYGTTIADHLPGLTSTDWLLIVVYSGVLVSLGFRLVSVKTFEVTGGAVLGGMEYMHTMLSIVLPILVLHEVLSIEILVGALLILAGVYLTESHPHPHVHMLHLASRRSHRKLK